MEILFYKHNYWFSIRLALTEDPDLRTLDSILLECPCIGSLLHLSDDKSIITSDIANSLLAVSEHENENLDGVGLPQIQHTYVRLEADPVFPEEFGPASGSPQENCPCASSFLLMTMRSLNEKSKSGMSETESHPADVQVVSVDAHGKPINTDDHHEGT